MTEHPVFFVQSTDDETQRPLYFCWHNGEPMWHPDRAWAEAMEDRRYAEFIQKTYGGEVVPVTLTRPVEVPPVISDFRGSYFFLSNFHVSPVYGWRTAEHAFQARKFQPGSAHRQAIAKLVQPAETKHYAKAHKADWRPDWFEVNVEVMADIVTQKFAIPDMRRLLLATGKAELVEGNTWGDVFWGVCNGKGQNMLGLILMAERLRISERVAP